MPGVSQKLALFLFITITAIAPQVSVASSQSGCQQLLLFKNRVENPLLLDASEAANATSHITVDPKREIGKKDPYFHQVMTEYLGQGVEQGLHADLMKNGSFEGVPQENGLPSHWSVYPNPRLNNVEWRYELTDQNSVPQHLRPSEKIKQQALRVIMDDNHKSDREGMLRGISQHELYIQDNKEYEVKMWVKADGHYDGHLKLTFGPPGEEPQFYDMKTVGNIDGEWREYSVTMKPRLPKDVYPKGEDKAAWFTIQFEGRGRLLLDQISIIPNDSVDGIRKDVFSYLKRLRPDSTRNGGIAKAFLENDAMMMAAPSRTYWFNGWERGQQSAQFGEPEYLKMAKNLGATPTMTVNLHGEKALEKTMNLLEYMFGDSNSQYGRLRTDLGLPEALNPKDVAVEFDNEPWLPGFGGLANNPAHKDVHEYARLVNQFAKAIHAKYPQVKLIASGDRNPGWYETVIRESGQHLWGIALHWYMEWSQREYMIAASGEIEQVLRRMLAVNHKYNKNHKLRIAMNEWNTRLAMPFQHGMESGVYNASVWNMLIRNSPFTTMSTNALTINSYPGNLVNSDEWGHVFGTPTYWQNLLYQRRTGPTVVTSKVEGKSYHVNELRSTMNGQDIPYLDTASTLSKDGSRLYIYVVNRNMNEDLPATVNVLNAPNVKRVRWEIIRAKDIFVTNTFEQPDNIKIEELPVTNPSANMVMKFPKHSISVITVQLRKAKE